MCSSLWRRTVNRAVPTSSAATMSVTNLTGVAGPGRGGVEGRRRPGAWWLAMMAKVLAATGLGS